MKRKSAKNKKRTSGKKNKFALIFMVIVGLIIVICIIGYKYVSNSYHGEDRWLYIPSDATEKSVRDSLDVHLGESSERVFMMWKLAEGTPQVAYGAYYVEDGTKEIDIARRLKRGQQSPVKVTINNCRTMKQLAEKVSSKMVWESDDFLQACDSVLPTAGFTAKEQYPAAFLPDTYEFYWTSEPERVVQRLLEYRNKFWSEERRAKAKSMGLNPVKIATIASIVEEETNKRDERPMVARLYMNRLEKSMPLQADPTVKYAIGDFSLRRINNTHLQVESPYNTYRRTGLPPGPIRIVEKATLEAVLDAPKHNYLYMCAKEDFSGYHNFAVDYSAHLSNARKYQAELNKRKIYK